MKMNFEGRGNRWTGAAAPVERQPTDTIDKRGKIPAQPYEVKVRSDVGEEVTGTMLVTTLAESEAAKAGGNSPALLARAFGKALRAELGLRPLRSGFRFVVDHRWLVGN